MVKLFFIKGGYGGIPPILDGYIYLHASLIFFTTNHIELLDPALIRCGRMDEKYEFGYADENQIKDILNFYECTSENIPDQLKQKSITCSKLIEICLSHTFK